MFRTTSLIAACAATAAFSANAFIVDDFEVDSSANYTVLDDGSGTPAGDGTPDSTVDFVFDYVAAGIPLAPNSTAGDTLGLKFTANDTSADAGAPDHITAFHNTAITSSVYTLQVDMYMQVEAAGGSTEYAHIGVAGAPTEFNSVFTPVAGTGHFVAMTGEGGSSTSDYRHFTPTATTTPTSDPSYLAGTGNAQAGALYAAIFPSPTFEFEGSPGNSWVTVTIDVNPQTVTYSLNGTPIIITPTEAIAGQVSLGYADVFSSVGPHAVIYDNLQVIPEPASLALLAAGLGIAGLRRRSA